MSFRAMHCPSCGGPLPPEAKRRVVICTYCHATVSYEQEIVHAAEYRAALARFESAVDPQRKIRAGGTDYQVFGRVARGESSDVFLAARSRPITERVLIKILRSLDDADLMKREVANLNALQSSNARGAYHFTRVLPQPITHGPIENERPHLPALVLRALPGFAHDLTDVKRAFSGGLDLRHIAWIWRRTLELLGFVHEAGFIHGAILPQHILINARDHGVSLAGWSASVRASDRSPIAAVLESRRMFYPVAIYEGAPATPATDLIMSARCMIDLLGENVAPAPIATLLEEFAQEHETRLPTREAWKLAEMVAAAAREAYGPPSFVKLEIPSF